MQMLSYYHIHFFLCIFFFAKFFYFLYNFFHIFFIVLKIFLFFFYKLIVNDFFWIFPFFFPMSFFFIYSYRILLCYFQITFFQFCFLFIRSFILFLFFSFLWLFLSYSSLLPSLLPLQFICFSVSVKCFFFHFSLCTFYTTCLRCKSEFTNHITYYPFFFHILQTRFIINVTSESNFFSFFFIFPFSMYCSLLSLIQAHGYRITQE